MTKKTTAKKTPAKTTTAKKAKTTRKPVKAKAKTATTATKAKAKTKSAAAVNDTPKKVESKSAATAPKVAPKPAPAAMTKDSADVNPSPPVMVLLFVVLGITLDWLIPMNFGHGWGAFGLILSVLSIGTIMWCGSLFQKHGTNINPAEPTLTIIEEGPYQYTRNPMYVGFITAYIGLAMMADAPLMVLLAAGLWYVLDKKVVAKEEAYLEEKFGEEYLDYKFPRKRWL